MKQKIEYSSPEVISMEEYLAKRKRIREDIREKQKRTRLQEDRRLHSLRCIYKRRCEMKKTGHFIRTCLLCCLRLHFLSLGKQAECHRAVPEGQLWRRWKPRETSLHWDFRLMQRSKCLHT